MKTYTFDEICESQDFDHDREFVLAQEAKAEIEELKYLDREAGKIILRQGQEKIALRELVKEVATAPNYMTTFAWAEIQQKAKEFLG